MIADQRWRAALSHSGLSAEQRAAFTHLTAEGDLKALVGLAGSGNSRLLIAAREAWAGEGYTVKGAALSGIAAENLALASGIASRTLASYEYAWQFDRDCLNARDVLVIDEAGLVGTRRLARILEAARDAHAKVVLVGDPALRPPCRLRGALAPSRVRHGLLRLGGLRRPGGNNGPPRERPRPVPQHPFPCATHRPPMLEFMPQYAVKALARSPDGRSVMDEIESRQQQAADRWREKQRTQDRGLEPTHGAE